MSGEEQSTVLCVVIIGIATIVSEGDVFPHIKKNINLDTSTLTIKH